MSVLVIVGWVVGLVIGLGVGFVAGVRWPFDRWECPPAPHPAWRACQEHDEAIRREKERT